MTWTLRPYQQDGYDAIQTALERHTAVLYQAPTGSGKTVLFTAMARNLADTGTRVCILVHRRELLRQASRALDAAGVWHNVVAPGYPHRDALVTVASKDTLTRRDGHEFDLLIIDEAHHATAATYQRIIGMADRTLGVTATPCRLTGNGLSTIFQHLILGPSIKTLTPQYLSPYKLFAPPCKVDLSGIGKRGGDYKRDDLASAMNDRSITGDAVEHYKRYLNGAPAIAFCASVPHAYQVAEQFQAAGFRATGVDGTLYQDTRDDRIRALGDGRLNVLTSCDLISEGLDIPVVSGAILLRPTASLTIYLQQIGRVLRPAPGKTHAVILDHVGNVWRHGLPDQDREWSLEDGVKQAREKDIRDAIRQCPACWYAHDPAPVCPACGYVYKVKPKKPPSYVEGVLSQVTVTEEKMQDVLAKARTLQDFQLIAKHKGYKPGWAWYRFKQRLAGKKLEAV